VGQTAWADETVGNNRPLWTGSLSIATFSFWFSPTLPEPAQKEFTVTLIAILVRMPARESRRSFAKEGLMVRLLIATGLVIGGGSLFLLSYISPAIRPGSSGPNCDEGMLGMNCLVFSFFFMLGSIGAIASGQFTFEACCCLAYLPANLIILFSIPIYLHGDGRFRKLYSGLVGLAFIVTLTVPWCPSICSGLCIGYYFWCASFLLMAVGLALIGSPNPAVWPYRTLFRLPGRPTPGETD
jgi:hypothetical protein